MIKIDTHTGRSHEKNTIKIRVSHARIPGSISKKRFIMLLTVSLNERRNKIPAKAF